MPQPLDKMIADLNGKIARLEQAREHFDPHWIVHMQQAFQSTIHRLRRRNRDDGSMPALVEPPRGPRPLSGGAAAPLEFDS